MFEIRLPDNPRLSVRTSSIVAGGEAINGHRAALHAAPVSASAAVPTPPPPITSTSHVFMVKKIITCKGRAIYRSQKTDPPARAADGSNSNGHFGGVDKNSGRSGGPTTGCIAAGRLGQSRRVAEFVSHLTNCTQIICMRLIVLRTTAIGPGPTGRGAGLTNR